ncbi:MAG: tetratricopeptide repeat protein, partial [Planctomycetes bacterium]|nr:tetratricopeptide repeat protein [Planctomycetota bacterium]
LLVTSHFLLKRDTAGFLAFGLFTCLTKGGAVFLLFMFVASLLLFAHQRGEAARLFAKLAGVVLVVVVLIVVSGHAVGALREWRKTLHGTDYGGRFSLLGRAANGDTDVMRRLGGVALRQSAIVLVASCFLPFGCLLRAERGSLFFLSVGLLAHFTVCASNPVWTRTEPAAHHPTYFSPAANLLALAGLRSLSAMSFASPKRLALLALLAATASLVGCRIVLGFYDRVWALQSYAHQEDSIAAVADSYLRRAKAALDAKDFDAMAREADKVFRLDYYHYPASPTIRRQQALANHFIGCHHARKGDLATAEVKLKAALELNPKLVAAHVSMAAVLLDQGRKAEAKGWIEDGLRLAPEDAELRRLARRADETAK